MSLSPLLFLLSPQLRSISLSPLLSPLSARQRTTANVPSARGPTSPLFPSQIVRNKMVYASLADELSF